MPKGAVIAVCSVGWEAWCTYPLGPCSFPMPGIAYCPDNDFCPPAPWAVDSYLYGVTITGEHEVLHAECADKIRPLLVGKTLRGEDLKTVMEKIHQLCPYSKVFPKGFEKIKARCQEGCTEYVTFLAGGPEAGYDVVSIYAGVRYPKPDGEYGHRDEIIASYRAVAEVSCDEHACSCPPGEKWDPADPDCPCYAD